VASHGWRLAGTSAAFSRRGLHGQVVDELGIRIVTGQLQPGATIDPEALEDEFDVSRTVVRESVRVLVSKGLIDARPRAGTYVLDREYWNLLDADLMAWRISKGLDSMLARELAEVRSMIEPYAVRLAAERATPEEIDAIEAALDRMEAAALGPIEDATDADIEFHSAILRAAGNELMSNFHILLGPALRMRDLMTLARTESRGYLMAHRNVLEAVRSSDGDQAADAIMQLLSGAARDAESALAALAATEQAPAQPPAQMK
jgi:DNA-binding FadR family transcriptional regulator